MVYHRKLHAPSSGNPKQAHHLTLCGLRAGGEFAQRPQDVTCKHCIAKLPGLKAFARIAKAAR